MTSMKKNLFLLFFTLLLSFSAFSQSAVYVTEDQTHLRSDRSNTSDKNIILTLSKNQKLNRLIMHYSGWSEVSIDGKTGWILSSKLTADAPKNIAFSEPSSPAVNLAENPAYIESLEKLKTLESNIERLSKENFSLSSQVIDLKETNKQNTTALQKRYTDLEAKNQQLIQKNIALNSQLDSASKDELIDTLLKIFFGLIIGIIFSFLVAKIIEKRKRSFNTIRL